MKSFMRFVFTGILTVAAITSVMSCNHSFIEEPNTSEITASVKNISAPKNLVASQGECRKIVLNWDKISNAKQYLIYSASSPFDNFVKIAETSGNANEFEYSVESGKTIWFRVTAVSFTDEESSMSSYVFGSSMAIPNITSIILGKDGVTTTATVNWWMSNCYANTYQNNVNYKVTCYEKDMITVFDSQIVTGETKSVTFSGLLDKSVYYYQVEAYITGSDKAEMSDLADAETARKTTPAAPENVECEKGIKSYDDGEGISIRWILPEGVDYKVSSNIYDVHPLYFTIERKLLNEDETAFKTLVDYIGTFDSTTENGIYFTCDGSAPSSGSKKDNLTIDSSETNPENAISNYEAYIAGTKIKYTDLTAEAGKQYSYRIRSFADDVGNKTISSDTSYVDVEGWLISSATITVEADYTDTYIDENDSKKKFNTIKVNFDFEFDQFGLDNENFYKYVLTSSEYDLETETLVEENKLVRIFDSVADIKAFSITYDDGEEYNLESDKNYYTYRIYICSSDTTEVPSDSSKYYEATLESSRITVTKDADDLPIIDSFTVTDGFKDKFLLTWSYNPAYTYILKWNEEGKNEVNSLPLSTSVEEGKGKFNVSENTATFEHAALSGENRNYTLVAKSLLETTRAAGMMAKTLGTAEISMNTLSYDKIIVTWNAVQKADAEYTYESVYASYDGSSENLVTESNTEITLNSETKVYTCVIDKPAGYDSAKTSGSQINLKIASKNTTTNDETVSSVQVCTFGPANIKATKGTLDGESITVKWNAVAGAAGYVINRVRYKDNLGTEIADQTDTYFIDPNSYVDSEKNKTTKTHFLIIRNGNELKTTEMASVKLDGSKFALTDYDFQDSEELNQSKVSWGLPYGYEIIPVLKDADDFSFSGAEVTADGNSNVSYVDILSSSAFVKNATFGYGLNVAASKSEYTSTVTITWERPYENEVAVPYIYRRQSGSSTWKKLGSVSLDAVSYSDDLAGEDKTKAYYYAVQYLKASSDLTEKASYKEHLEQKDKRYTDGIESEELNKGYMFYIDFAATPNCKKGTDGQYVKDADYYSQKVSHTLWDFEERARGPEAYTIKAKNINTTYDEIKIVDISVDRETGIESYAINAQNEVLNGDGGDTGIKRSGSDFVLYPIAMTNALLGRSSSVTKTEGILKVLRSTKTLYTIETSYKYQLEGKDEKTVNLTETADGYRQITGDEMARCMGLIIADSLYQASIPYSYSADFIGQPKNDATNTCSGFTGSFTITHTSWANYSQWGMTDYKHIFHPGTSSKYGDPEKATPTGAYKCISDFTLNAGLSDRVKGSESNVLYYMAPLTITVKHASGLDSCEGEIYFTAGTSGTSTSWTLTVKKDGEQIASASDQTTFLSYFPYDIGTKHSSSDKTINTSLQTYKNDWWK